MKNKIKVFVTVLSIFAFCGCDFTGSLNKKEKDSILSFLEDNNYIDEKCELTTDGRGEGELFLYYCDTSINGQTYRVDMIQRYRYEDYRVFRVYLYQDEAEKKIVEVKIDRETGEASLYEDEK